jgi:hypothetical protein
LTSPVTFAGCISVGPTALAPSHCVWCWFIVLRWIHLHPYQGQ